MELWLLYSIIAALFWWISGFSQKIANEYKVDAFFLILMQSLVMIIISLWIIISHGTGFILKWESVWILFLLFILSASQFFNTRVRAEILKYLSSSEYFVSFRILTVGVLTVFWMIIFHEFITVTQLIGLVIWSCGIVLLFEEDTRLQHSRNWFRAIYLLIISVILGAVIQISAKYLTLESWDITLILFYEGVFLLLLSLLFSRKKMLTIFSHRFRWSELNISILFALSIYIAAICNFLAFYYGGPVGIVTKILGYSVFIPIVLSIIFYSEKFSIKKWIAFILTIISIYYLS